MAKKDKIHDAVKNALIKDGWKIIADSYHVVYEDEEIVADLAAEAPLEAERAGQTVVIEIKTLQGASLIYELHQAIGQYVNYRSIIRRAEPELTVYLAFSEDVFDEIKRRKGLRVLFEDSAVYSLVVNVKTEEIVTWIEDWTTVS